MSEYWVKETSDLDGIPSRIAIRESYSLNQGSTPSDVRWSQFTENTSFSPPLSQIEITDIEASEAELSSENVRTYDTAEEFLGELRALRSRYQREHSRE